MLETPYFVNKVVLKTGVQFSFLSPSCPGVLRHCMSYVVACDPTVPLLPSHFWRPALGLQPRLDSHSQSDPCFYLLGCCGSQREPPYLAACDLSLIKAIARSGDLQQCQGGFVSSPDTPARCLWLVLGGSPGSTALGLACHVQWVSAEYPESGRSIFTENSCSFPGKKRGLGVRRDRTAQALMFFCKIMLLTSAAL